MKQQKLSGYTPNYPKKLLKGAALTAAAMLAIGGTACELRTEGAPPIPDDVSIETPAQTSDAAEDILRDPDLPGEPMPDEGEEPEGRTRGEVALQGKILIPEEPEQP